MWYRYYRSGQAGEEVQVHVVITLSPANIETLITSTYSYSYTKLADAQTFRLQKPVDSSETGASGCGGAQIGLVISTQL